MSLFKENLCFFIRTSNGWTFLSSEKKSLQVKQPGESSGWHLGSSEISGAARHFTPSGVEWKLKQRGLEPCMMFSDLSLQIWGSNTVDVSEIRLKFAPVTAYKYRERKFQKRKVPARCVAFFESLPWHTHPCHQKKNRSNSWQKFLTRTWNLNALGLTNLLTSLLFVDSSSSCELHLMMKVTDPPPVLGAGLNLHYNDWS